MTPGTLDLTMYRGATFGPLTLQCERADQSVVNLTGYIAEAQVRSAPNKPLILDLAPTIPTPANGKVVIYFTDEQTEAITLHGIFTWDFFLINPSGERLGPFVAGTFTIKLPVTKP